MTTCLRESIYPAIYTAIAAAGAAGVLAVLMGAIR